MECVYEHVYSSPPVVACDDYNIYVCRGDTITSSDVGEGKLGSVPFTVAHFIRHYGRYYFLDDEGRLWCEGQLRATAIRAFNNHHALGYDGRVWTLEGIQVPLQFPVMRLFGDLVLDNQAILYDSHGQYITSQVAEAHTDGNEIIVIHQGSSRVLEYIGDNTNKQLALRQILQVQGAQKAIINQGSLLLLLGDGTLVAAGANRNCECGTSGTPVSEPQKFHFPAPVLDFGFHQRVGWALLGDHSVYVWGYNDSDALFFLQWPKEHFISPRLLSL